MTRCAFRFGKLRSDRPVDDAMTAFIRVEADFAIEVGGATIYEEAMFPVVELAASLSRWLSEIKDGRAKETSSGSR
jgi:hypothetical protein